MSAPTLSVLMPNYNHARLLPQAVEAVVTQSRTPDEFILLDDASTDDSVEVMARYAHEHPWIRVIRQETNRGVVAALRTLVGAATGDYVYCGAADDFVLPGFLQGAMAMAQEYPRAGIVFGQVAMVTPEGEEVIVSRARKWTAPLFAPPEAFLREYLDVELASHSLSCATIYRRDALGQVGGFRGDLGHWADTFALRAVGLEHGVCYVPERWAAYRVMPDSFYRTRKLDFPYMLAIVRRAAELMRSPEFRNRFPEYHVRRWERAWNASILDDYIWTLREPFGRSAWGMLRGRLLKRYLRLLVALYHRGDVAAFIRRHEPRDREE